MPEPHPFRQSVERRDWDLLRETLREDVVFHSPVLFRPFIGREVTLQVIAHVEALLTDFAYVDELAHHEAVALRFTARIGDREIEGIDFLDLDRDGRVATLTVFLRPQTAVQRFSAAMAERLQSVAPAKP